jgi:hypothetical protein
MVHKPKKASDYSLSLVDELPGDHACEKQSKYIYFTFDADSKKWSYKKYSRGQKKIILGFVIEAEVPEKLKKHGHSLRHCHLDSQERLILIEKILECMANQSSSQQMMKKI